jgi:hypothetical protein
VPAPRSTVVLLPVAASAIGCRNDHPSALEPDASSLATTALTFVSLTGVLWLSSLTRSGVAPRRLPST